MAMEERKQKRFVDAKKSWSRPTRAAISRFLFGRTTRFWRNLNQVVAAGPNIAGDVLVRSDLGCLWGLLGGRGCVNTSTIECHAACTCEFVVGEPFLLN